EAPLGSGTAGVRVPLGQAAAQRDELLQARTQSPRIGRDQFGQRAAGRSDDRGAAGERLENVDRTRILPAHRHPQAARPREQLALLRAADLTDEPDVARKTGPPSAREREPHAAPFRGRARPLPSLDAAQPRAKSVVVALRGAEFVLIQAGAV